MRGAGASSSPTHGTSLLPRSLLSALEDTENVPPNGLCHTELRTYSGGSLLALCSHLGRAFLNTDLEV